MIRRYPHCDLALVLTLLSFFSSQKTFSQNLESELPIEIKPEILPRNGSVPLVLDCELQKEDAQFTTVECSTDRKIKRVDCRFEGDTQNLLKAKVTDAGFQCQAPVDKRELMASLSVYLLANDLNFSEWIVRVASSQQLSRIYKAEMQSTFQSERVLPPYYVGASGSMLTGGAGGSTFYTGAYARMEFFQSMFGQLEYAKPFSQGTITRYNKIRADLGLKQRLGSGFVAGSSLIAEVDFAYRILGESGIKNLKAPDLAVSVGTEVLPGWLTTKMGLRAQWPEVQALRQSLEAVARFEIGPFFTHWRCDTDVAYISRVWQDSRLSIADHQIYAQLGVSWVH